MEMGMRWLTPTQTQGVTHIRRVLAVPEPVDKPRPGLYQRYFKRIFDVVVATIALVVLFPLMVLIAIAIKLDSPGPVLHVQKRLGKDGKVFDFYKFRSMRADVDHTENHRQFARDFILGRISPPDDEDEDRIYKPPSDDAHITRVGRFLRRTSLDELPQLINVIKGDMSLVGPRPNMWYELEYYKSWHKRRLEVLPGLTGLPQVRGRSRLRFDEIVELDIQYIENMSFWLDLEIILQTIPSILSGNGAG